MNESGNSGAPYGLLEKRNPGQLVPAASQARMSYPGVNHFYEMNCVFGITPGWDAKGFYGNVAKNFKARGF